MTTWVDPEGFMLSEKSQRDANMAWSYLYVKEQVGGC